MPKSQELIENDMSSYGTTVLHDYYTLSSKHLCVYDILKSILCLYITIWVQNDHLWTKMGLVHNSEGPPKSTFGVPKNHKIRQKLFFSKMSKMCSNTFFRYFWTIFGCYKIFFFFTLPIRDPFLERHWPSWQV